MKADQILQQGIKAMADRAASRDLPQGERSMLRTVQAYNALTGHNLSEHDGWLFMAIVKAARATAGKFNLDDYVDMAAYASLAGEAGGEQPDPTAVVESDWISWSGGPIPVSMQQIVEVKFRDGFSDIAVAGLFNWDHPDESDDFARDIIKYRLIK